MIERYVFQLKSLIPDLRREAIVYLAECADERAIAPLLHISRHDVVEELRNLAYDAVERIERDTGVKQGEVDQQAIDPLAGYLPKNIQPTDQDRMRAQRHI